MQNQSKGNKRENKPTAQGAQTKQKWKQANHEEAGYITHLIHEIYQLIKSVTIVQNQIPTLHQQCTHFSHITNT